MGKATKRTLKVAQVSPLWYPVPPKDYGGTELVVSRLTENLIKKGHKVTLFASGDSKTKGKLVSVAKYHLRKLGVPYLHDSYNILNLVEAFSHQKEFDIIHTHIDVYDPIFRHFSKVPSLATLHNPFWPSAKKRGTSHWHTYFSRVLLYNRFPDLPYVSISKKYQEICPAKIKFVKTIYHGVNLETLRFTESPGDYFAWFGRITKLKGIHLAIKLAKKMGFKLLIAGVAASPQEKVYLEKELKPKLTKRVKFVGKIKSDKEKSEFLGKAKGLIYPLQWEEPFGIVMAESLACGTPVIALNRGSVSEIVDNGKTGFVAENLEEMEKSIKRIEQIKRINCRIRAEKKFSVEKMTENYENLYYKTIKEYDSKI